MQDKDSVSSHGTGGTHELSISDLDISLSLVSMGLSMDGLFLRPLS